MKKLWLHSVRAYLRLGLFFYYKKIKVYNKEFIPKDKPVLFLGNHQNALLDPLLIAAKSGVFSYFLTRAAVFKKPLISKLLHSLQMLPVYRIRDGWSNLTNNTSIFKTCTELLHANKKVTIFPEGSHNINRTVRPLSKGFTRIVFETLEKYPDTDLQLIPVGFNYIKAEEFADSTALYFGQPINAKNYLLNNKNESVVKLKHDVSKGIAKLTTHIPSENYEENLKRLEVLNVDFLNPKAVNACIESNFTKCKTGQEIKRSLLSKFFKGILIILLFVPYVVWKKVAEPKVDEIEFLSTFRFTIAITLVPVWMLLVSVLLMVLFCWCFGLGYLITTLIIALVAVKL